MDEGYFNLEIKEVANMHPDKVTVFTNPKNIPTIRAMFVYLGQELRRIEQLEKKKSKDEKEL